MTVAGKPSYILPETKIYDCIGIGFGPSNMALAISLQEQGMLERCLFLEARPDFEWHPGMLIEGTDIQHNPLRDLVTPRNPSSPYGFLSYLSAQGRLFDFLNLAAPYPPRTEYASYIKWAGAQFLAWVRLGCRVSELRHATCPDGNPAIEVLAADGARYLGRTLAFGPGRSLNIPLLFQPLMGENVVHLNDYLMAKGRWLDRLARPRIAVVGGSQSAVEIVLDLAPHAQVASVSRGFGFKHKDLSPFTEAIYYPEFVDYFHNAGVAAQNRMTQELWRSNYSAADPDVVAQLNMLLYEQKVVGRETVRVLSNRDMLSVEDRGGTYLLETRERHSGQIDRLEVDGIVLATGFLNFGDRDGQEPYHPLLAGIAHAAEFRGDGGIAIDRTYKLVNHPEAGADLPVFINGLCESSHGFGDAGSFSLLSVRSETIAKAIKSYLSHDIRSQIETPAVGAFAHV